MTLLIVIVVIVAVAIGSGKPTSVGLAPDEKVVIGYRNGQPFALTVKHIGGGFYLSLDAADYFMAMRDSAALAGVVISVSSAFRTLKEQQYFYDLWLSGNGNQAAVPGTSDHQKGDSADIHVRDYPATLAWLRANAADFQFINDVPSEPHHWTFKRTQ